MKKNCFKLISLLLALFTIGSAKADMAMQNVMGRDRQSLNGQWAYIPDINDLGVGQKWFRIADHSVPTNFVEVNFESEKRLKVPGDWNSQHPELLYYESIMWYQRHFEFEGAASDTRQFIHFGAVCNDAAVYLNGKLLGKHVGGYTPFQFEVSDNLVKGTNQITVRVDNRRSHTSLPGMIYDWWNYGGITRDVDLVTTPKSYIEDYWIRLEKGSMKRVLADVQLCGEDIANKEVIVSFKGTKITKRATTDANGAAQIAFDAKLNLWSPESPTLYDVTISTANDKVEDRIGFRSFETRGTKLYLNNKEVFLKGVNLHEEIPHEMRRAVDKEDAEFLINATLELGCNFVRHTHYSPNEYMIRLCDEVGLMMWEEIPAWGSHIDFSNKGIQENATNMMREMMRRDKNRCGTIIWSVANETKSWDDARNAFLTKFINQCREWDNTRAITTASNTSRYLDGDNKNLTLVDPMADVVDIIAVNKYLGWYGEWGAAPEETNWITREDKPMIVSEFGAGALYGSHDNPENVNTFTEEYMAEIYRKNLTLFDRVPNLCGVTPWVLFDFRSTRRSNLKYQDNWNRKGLLSPNNEKKQAWHVMKEYYDRK